MHLFSLFSIEQTALIIYMCFLLNTILMIKKLPIRKKMIPICIIISTALPFVMDSFLSFRFQLAHPFTQIIAVGYIYMQVILIFYIPSLLIKSQINSNIKSKWKWLFGFGLLVMMSLIIPKHLPTLETLPPGSDAGLLLNGKLLILGYFISILFWFIYWIVVMVITIQLKTKEEK
ncbi:MAG: hypothetical protein EP298_04400 [Gammaproteobacteria bacterium]|nr:MAG: hypothetical protein EP298_04400 [Gammaproteobacteria bacterium]UTW41652.1 hypothetical protein KFE69_09050 [bacterium SCSIO 12844]